MATKKISELEAITEADGSDVLAIVDVSEGKTNKITKNNLLKGSGHTIEMSLNENYQIVLKLKNAEGTELSTATIDLPNENALTNISYSNGTLTLTKQSGVTSTVDISGLINGLATETALTNLANALKETIGIQTNTYDNTKTYNTGDIVVQNEKIYKANQDNITGTFDSSKWDEISLYEYQKLQDETIEENYKVVTKLQEDVEDLTERVEDAENNEITNIPPPATSHYLQDSADSRFRKFIPIGRTTQESDPTLENPVPIKNTGDNGSVNEKIQNKNLFNKNTIANGAIYRSNGNIDRDTAGTHQHSDYIEIEENTQYYITIKTFPSSNYGFAFYDNSKAFISSIASANLINTPSNSKYLRICWAKTGTYANDVNTTQVEKGQTATDYIEHAEQNLSFPIAEGQKLMEGDYLADDGIHHVSVEMVFNGTEYWQIYNISADMIQFFLTINGVKHITNRVTIMSNIAKGILIANRALINNNNSVYTSSTGLCFRIDEFTTLADFKAYLAEQYSNGTPVKVQYLLEEEQTEDFTSEQQTAWEQIKKARTYKNITHISSEDEIPANVEIEYVVDINTIDDRITALEAKVDLLEE